MRSLTLFPALLLLAACSRTPMNSPEAESLRSHLAKFVPVELTADVTSLSAGDHAALEKLIVASRLLDSIYLRQVWSRNIETLDRLRADGSDIGRLRERLFLLHMGPWSGIDGNKTFLDAIPDRPQGAAHYPEDMLKEEFEGWVKSLTPAQQDEARGYFSVVRRNVDGSLRIVPFNDEYRAWLA
ncbi:MAG: hypothetical protein AAB262_13420, partial [Elusimicrobiota bacterium]